MKRTRRLSFVLLGLVAVLGILGLTGKLYLNSPSGTADVAARLSRVIGAPVAVGGVDIGLTSSSLANVQLFETGPDSPPEPWAIISDLSADISAWELLRGGTPRELILENAIVSLRFDTNGRLLTRLPRPPGDGASQGIQEIRLSGGQLLLKQEDRPDLVVTGVDAVLRANGELFLLSGSASEQRWGIGTLAGSVRLATGDATVTVKLPSVAFTQSMLDDLPFVPTGIWKQVQADGKAAGELTLRLDPRAGHVYYKVTCAAEETQLQVTAIDLRAEQVRGRMIVEDGLVQLPEITGKSADGIIRTSADLDFRGATDRLSFCIDVDRLRLRGLPKKWFESPTVQQLFDGRLSGRAEIQVTVDQGRASAAGHGAGIVREARFAGLPAESIRLRLLADGRGFRINVPPPDPDAPKPQMRAIPAETPGFGQVVNWSGSLLRRTADQILGMGVDATANAQRLARKLSGAEGRPPMLEIDLSVRDADLEELLRNLEVKVPLTLRGRGSFSVHVGIPLDTVHDPKTFQLYGRIGLDWLQTGGLELRDLQAQLELRNGVLHLGNLEGKIPGQGPAGSGPPTCGSFSGYARLQLIPAGDVTLQVAMTEVPLSQVARLLPDASREVAGAFSGSLTFRGPLTNLREVSTWRASASLASQRLHVLDWELTDAKAELRLRDGQLLAEEADGNLEGMVFTGTGRLSLLPPFGFAASTELTGGNPTARERLARRLPAAVQLPGLIALSAQARGTLRPAHLEASGTAAAAIADVADFRLEEATARWRLTGDQLHLSELSARAFTGELTGEGTLPLTPPASGQLLLGLQGVDVAGLVSRFVAAPPSLKGKVSGKVELSFAAAKPEAERAIGARAELSAARLNVQGVPTERVRANLEYESGALDYRLAGEALGGRVHLEGHWNGSKPGPDLAVSQGELHLEGLQFGPLWDALAMGTALRPLRGSMDLDLEFRNEGAEWKPAGKGRLALRRLSWNEHAISEGIEASVVLGDDAVRFKDLSGSIGQGILRGQVTYNFRRPARSRFSVALDRVEAQRLLTPWPALAAQLDGTLEIRLRGNFGSEWRGSGEAALARGSLRGVEIVNWRLPFDFSFTPHEGRGDVEIRETTAQVALGQATGRASLGWGAGSRMEGSVRFFGVDLRGLARALGDIGQVGAGSLNGRIDFTGTDVQAAENLTASIEASMQQTQALQLPVLRQLTPYLLPGQSSSVFQSGELRARLTRGVVRIQRLRLVGLVVQLILEGTITLQGRLDLEAIANTGGLSAQVPFLRQLGLQAGDGTPLPGSVIAQVSRLLSLSLVRVHIGGTVQSPILQRESILMLTEEAVRFFLSLAGGRR